MRDEARQPHALRGLAWVLPVALVLALHLLASREGAPRYVVASFAPFCKKTY